MKKYLFDEYEPKTPKELSELTESFYQRSMELPDELLVGAIDSHVHAGPVLSSNPGHLDPIEVAIDAREQGMKAIMFYSVFGEAAGMAWITNRHVPGIQTFGGYLMNSGDGGLNPRAVKSALYTEQGCRFVSFGSHCTRYQAEREMTLVDGKLVPIMDVYPKFKAEEISRAVAIPLEDPVPPELDEILSMIAEKPEVYLNTGHVSVEEAFRIIDLAERYGIKKVQIAHPTRALMTIEQQKEAAARGVWLEAALVDWFGPNTPKTHYYVEREYMDMGSLLPYEAMTAPRWLEPIMEVGPEHFVIGTDYGVRAAPTPSEGMRILITTMLDCEIPVKAIRQMTAENPAKLIGIE